MNQIQHFFKIIWTHLRPTFYNLEANVSCSRLPYCEETMFSVKILLGKYTSRAQHEPVVHVVVHLRRLPGLGLDLFTQTTGIRNTRET